MGRKEVQVQAARILGSQPSRLTQIIMSKDTQQGHSADKDQQKMSMC